MERYGTRPRSSTALLLALAGVLLLPVGAYARDVFTIAVIPDTQNYPNATKPQPQSLATFLAETRFLAEHRHELKLAFVTHVGDVVQHGDGTNGTPGDRTWGAGAEWVSENLRIGMNEAGHPVYQVLSDYQGNTSASSGGDGWLRLMTFDLQSQTIHFTTYSPVLDKHAGQKGERTFNQPPEFSDFTLPIPVQVGNEAGRSSLAR